VPPATTVQPPPPPPRGPAAEAAAAAALAAGGGGGGCRCCIDEEDDEEEDPLAAAADLLFLSARSSGSFVCFLGVAAVSSLRFPSLLCACGGPGPNNKERLGYCSYPAIQYRMPSYFRQARDNGTGYNQSEEQGKGFELGFAAACGGVPMVGLRTVEQESPIDTRAESTSHTFLVKL
jgi:hypothetical protein